MKLTSKEDKETPMQCGRIEPPERYWCWQRVSFVSIIAFFIAMLTLHKLLS